MPYRKLAACNTWLSRTSLSICVLFKVGSSIYIYIYEREIILNAERIKLFFLSFFMLVKEKCFWFVVR